MTKTLYAKYKHPDWPSALVLPANDPIENYISPLDLDDLTYSEVWLTDQEYEHLREFEI